MDSQPTTRRMTDATLQRLYQHFIDDPIKPGYLRCMYCLNAGSTGGSVKKASKTSNYWAHLKRYHNMNVEDRGSAPFTNGLSLSAEPEEIVNDTPPREESIKREDDSYNDILINVSPQVLNPLFMSVIPKDERPTPSKRPRQDEFITPQPHEQIIMNEGSSGNLNVQDTVYAHYRLQPGVVDAIPSTNAHSTTSGVVRPQIVTQSIPPRPSTVDLEDPITSYNSGGSEPSTSKGNDNKINFVMTGVPRVELYRNRVLQSADMTSRLTRSSDEPHDKVLGAMNSLLSNIIQDDKSDMTSSLTSLYQSIIDNETDMGDSPRDAALLSFAKTFSVTMEKILLKK